MKTPSTKLNSFTFKVSQLIIGIFIAQLIWLSSLSLLGAEVASAYAQQVDEGHTSSTSTITNTSTITGQNDTATRLNIQETIETAVAEATSQLELTISRTELRPTELSGAYINHVATNEIKHGDRAKQSVALTFDCEGTYEQIKLMVDLLNAGEAKGTFFLLGNTVASHPEIVPMIRNAGHELGNHSYSHPKFSTLTYTVAITEIAMTEAVISQAAGEPVPMRYFRFPYGDRTQENKNWLAELGYQSIFWDVDPLGWHHTITSTDVISTITHTTQPGSIVLMHCGRPADELALPTVITNLKEQGYTLETLSQVIPPDPVWE